MYSKCFLTMLDPYPLYNCPQRHFRHDLLQVAAKQLSFKFHKDTPHDRFSKGSSVSTLNTQLLSERIHLSFFACV